MTIIDFCKNGHEVSMKVEPYGEGEIEVKFWNPNSGWVESQSQITTGWVHKDPEEGEIFGDLVHEVAEYPAEGLVDYLEDDRVVLEWDDQDGWKEKEVE